MPKNVEICLSLLLLIKEVGKKILLRCRGDKNYYTVLLFSAYKLALMLYKRSRQENFTSMSW